MGFIFAIEQDLCDNGLNESVSFFVNCAWTLVWTICFSLFPIVDTEPAEMVLTTLAFYRILNEIKADIAFSEVTDMVFRKNRPYCFPAHFIIINHYSFFPTLSPLSSLLSCLRK